MTIPTRWHKPSCKTPQVVVDRNVPECRTCGGTASALLQKAAEEPAPSYSGIKIPPDAPIGQMDLWWPPCVPYTRDGSPRAQRAVASRDAASLTAQASDSSLSEIYTSTLGKDHFRLLYLSGSRLIDSPIHGDLVEYQQDDCPEYETTSYTWGGEDSDATPCRPAYFGDFWDVLFLTRNCWSLLQYLRPEMGTRLVWVDAICINQNNMQERGAQVSSMPQIYRKCMRVVIYIGDHLVRKEEHRFRQKIRHDDITKHGDRGPVDDSGLDIRGSIFQSRYISRLWIIQELTLAPYAILALKNHDLYLSNNFLHSFSRKEDGRKWLEYMGQDYKLRQATLYEGLRMTIDSQATDPRDRIFGILGILGANPVYSKIVPDYSISMRDCFIGAIGATVINSKEIWPLLRAHPSDMTPGIPSWMPSQDQIATRADKPASRIKRFMPLDVFRVITHGRGKWATAIRVGEFPEGPPPSHEESGRCLCHSCGMTPESFRVESEIPWYQNASMDSSSGALTVRLVRVFDKPQKILVEKSHELDDPILLVKGASSEARFFFRSMWTLPKGPDHTFHVFIAFLGQNLDFGIRLDTIRSNPDWWTSDMCLVLADEAEAGGTFKLLSCVGVEDAVFFSKSPPARARPFQLPSEEIGISRRSSRNVLSLFDTLHHTLNYNTRKWTLLDRETDADLRWWMPPPVSRVTEAMHFDMIVPGQGSIASGFLQLSLAAARAGEPATVTEEFRRAYAACLQAASAEFNPVLDDEYVWFTLADSDSLSRYWDNLIRNVTRIGEINLRAWPWKDLFPYWFDLQIPGIGETEFKEKECPYYCARKMENGGPGRCPLHRDYEPRSHLGLHYWLPCAEEPPELQMPVRARMPLRKVVEAIRATRLNWYHRYLLAFSEKVSEDVEALLERGPQPKDSNIYLHGWPKSLVDELGFVWRNESVTFV